MNNQDKFFTNNFKKVKFINLIKRIGRFLGLIIKDWWKEIAGITGICAVIWFVIWSINRFGLEWLSGLMVLIFLGITSILMVIFLLGLVAMVLCLLWEYLVDTWKKSL